MTRFRFRRLKKWQTGTKGSEMELAIPLPTSDSGLVLRWCPNEQCQPRRFQLGDPAQENAGIDEGVTTRRTPGEPETTCPYCGTDDADEAFVAPEDEKAALEQVNWAIQQDVGEWLDGLAKDFNRKIGGRRGLINISMSSPHRPKPAPRAWREDLLRVLECRVCTRTYGVYALGFFCPDCGCANFAHQFDREVALIIAQVDIAEQIAEEDSRELAFRLLGNAHEDVVTAFETYLKNSFRLAARARFSDMEWDELQRKELRGNPFQNLERAEGLFGRLQVDLFVDLTKEERDRVALNFEKRHVVGHNLGIADEKFVDVSESDNVGETVLLLAHEVEEFARSCSQVIGRVERELPELHPEGPDGSSTALWPASLTADPRKRR